MGTQIRGSQIKDATVTKLQLLGTDIDTVGTITSGTWNGTTIALANGGTGATTASGARTNLELGSIATQAANNVSITGGSITGITDLAVADGGTGASDASGARTNLGLAIGTDVQAYNATLAAVAGGTYTGDDSITTVGTISSGTWQGTAIANTYLPKLNGFTAPDGSVSLNSQKITNLATPTSSTDAATKAYVDNAHFLRDVKDSVRTAAVGGGVPVNVNISSAPATIGGVTCTNGDRVLLLGQTTGSENGIYVFNGSGSAMTRSTDADEDAEVTTGMYVFVEEGNAASSAFVLTTAMPISVGTTSLTFNKFSTLQDLVAGAGLTKTGYTVDVVSANGGIVVNADNIALTLNGSSLNVSGSGLRVADAGVTEHHLATSVAGNGLTGGAGTALSVNVTGVMAISSDSVALQHGAANVTSFNSTHFENAAGEFKVKASAISATELAASAVTASKLGITQMAEALSGTKNGSNTSFSLSQTPAATANLMLFLNGLYLTPTTHYSVSGTSITMSEAPLSGDDLRAVYFY